MSHMVTSTTEIRDEGQLVKALEALEPTWKGHIERHAEPVHLNGYHGDQRKEVAHVRIDRKYVSATSNDIGFIRGADGKFTAIISEFDRGIGGKDGAWLGKLSQHYAVEVVKREQILRGYRLVEQKEREDGSIEIVVEV